MANFRLVNILEHTANRFKGVYEQHCNFQSSVVKNEKNYCNVVLRHLLNCVVVVVAVFRHCIIAYGRSLVPSSSYFRSWDWHCQSTNSGGVRTAEQLLFFIIAFTGCSG